jgi:hypothetical protein
LQKALQVAKDRRFPDLLCVAIPSEIREGLQRATLNGMLSISDAARLSMYRDLVAQGFIAPPAPTQAVQSQPANGGQHARP